MSHYAGIDPGAEGALALLDRPGNLIKIIKFKGKNEHQIIDEVKALMLAVSANSYFDDELNIKTAIEKVNGIPTDRPSHAFTFGKSYGGLRYMLAALELPYIEVHSSVWMTEMRCKTGGNKKISQAAAHKLHPKEVKQICQKSADAVMIANWLRMTEIGGKLG